MSRSYHPTYATTYGDAGGYNHRQGENDLYNSFRAFYANPAASTMDDVRAQRDAAVQRADACVAAIDEAAKSNLNDLTTSSLRNAAFLSSAASVPATLAAPAPRSAADEKVMAYRNTSTSASTSSDSKDFFGSRSKAGTGAFSSTRPPPVVTGCESISKRVPAGEITQHIPGYGGFIPAAQLKGVATAGRTQGLPLGGAR